MMRRVLLTPLASVPMVRFASSNDGKKPDYSGPIPGATGVDNKAGLYSEKTPDAYFEKAFPNRNNDLFSKQGDPNEPPSRADNIKYPEFDTAWGKFEITPGFAGGPPSHRYQKYVRKPADTEGVAMKDIIPGAAFIDHHPDFNYASVTGKKEGNATLHANTWVNWEIRAAKMSLYRACLKSIPLAKHFYWLTIPIDKMKDKIRVRFLQNRHVKDPDAIRHLLHAGWMEYSEVVMTRRTRGSVTKFFGDDENTSELMKKYADEEAKLQEDRKFWGGEEQRKEGPYNGHWSWIGQECELEFERIAGRVPTSWTTSKGYFEKFQADGTNYWEKNLDYEGWFTKNIDPDVKSARLEMQGWTESGYNQPKHYASKNRRGYRRLVKDIETIMNTSVEDMYTKNREMLFQYLIRETRPESNRISAERTLALQDDNFYSTKFEEYEKYMKQAMREMPNPRLWRTDAFYFRLRYLVSALEYNWAKVPIGAAQEKLFNEWISDNTNYGVYTSKQFEEVKKDKTRNPMAKTFADFYAAFDPDVPETRQLPWYHPEFNYDRRYKWDERCMRQKKWVQSGTVDSKNDFFTSIVVEWEQYVNRPERMNEGDSAERRYAAPRMVQLYRALNKLMDVALVNQLVAFAKLEGLSAEAAQKKLAATDLSKFSFAVPTIIYPDGFVQPKLGLDGSAIGPAPESATPAEASSGSAAASATA